MGRIVNIVNKALDFAVDAVVELVSSSPAAFLLIAAYTIVSGAFLIFGSWACIPALIPFAIFWFKQRSERHKLLGEVLERVTDPPSDLPAAAVCKLMGMVETAEEIRPGPIRIVRRSYGEDRIHLTVVLEMIHKGTLKLVKDGSEFENSDKSTYRLEAQPGPKSAWEQALCDRLPQVSLDGEGLGEWLSFSLEGVSPHLLKYLEDRGLASPPQSERRTGLEWLRAWAPPMMWVGILFSMWWVVWNWLGWWGLLWWPGMVTIGLLHFGAMDNVYESLKRVRAQVDSVTDRGRAEAGQWNSFGSYLGSLTFIGARRKDPDGTDPLMPYASALNRMDSWQRASRRRASRRRGPLLKDPASRPGVYPDDASDANAAKKLGLDAAMLISIVGISGGGTDLGMDMDFDMDIDLSI